MHQRHAGDAGLNQQACWDLQEQQGHRGNAGLGSNLVEVQRVAAASDAVHLLHGLGRHDLGPEVHQVGQQQEHEEGWAVAEHMVPQLQPVNLGQHLCHHCGQQAPGMRLNGPWTCIDHALTHSMTN